MSAMEPSGLALFWAAVIALAILVYVILDGFDLGVGILFGTTRDAALREEMMAAISPFWDGNETWLVVIGASLFAAFPVVYAVFLPAFYIPVLLLLFGLIFRGVAFEFRYGAGGRALWDWGFFLGSTVAAFVQGAAVGAMIRGIPVVNNQYAGGPFEWLRPLPVLTGIGLVLGYALLGAGWLTMKTDGALRDWAWRRISRLAGAVLVVMGIAIIAALFARARMTGILFLGRPWGLVFPALGLLAMARVFTGVRERRDGVPFMMSVVFFIAGFLSLAVMFWPYMIPYSVTVASAAAPDKSLSFMFWGAGVFVLPVIVIYTAVVYWVFRGRFGRSAMASNVAIHRPRVVIIGAGFGGLSAAKSLAKAPFDVVLIDHCNYHMFQPLLYQVATAALSPDNIAWPIRTMFRRDPNVSVVLANVSAIDTERNEVIADGHRILFDYLIVATGARQAYFGHSDWAQHAPGLKTIDNAMYLRRRILLAFEKAETEPDPDERRRLLNFVVVGGGATGVELTGAIAELAKRALASDFRAIDPRSARIVLVEAAPRVLRQFDESLSRYAQRALEQLGAEVRLGTEVTGCDEAGISMGTERIESRTIMWSAGVEASPAGQWLGAESDRAGRVKVGPDLSLPGRTHIFALGDTALVAGGGGTPLPGVAPVAKQQGAYVARVIAARAEGRSVPPFQYRDFGMLAIIGRSRAVAQFGRIKLSGLPAWLLWCFAHIYFLIGFTNRLFVMLNWAWNFLTFRRGARLITDGLAPMTDIERADHRSSRTAREVA